VSIAPRRLAAVAAAAVLVPSLSGCWAGFDAQTSVQANQAVGNGASLSTGDMQILGATWVRNVDNASEATLVATFVNDSDVPDKLVKVEVQPAAQVGITGAELEVPVDGSLRVGYWSPNFINVFGLQAFPSTFVPTTFTFENAGTVTGDVLAMPNEGQYSGVVVSLEEQQKLQDFVSDQADDSATATENVAKGKKKKQAAQQND
jgi:hypothetical protein